MNSHRFFLATVCSLLLSSTNCATGEDRRALMPDAHSTLFKEHCLACHDAETQEGSVDLDNLSFEISKDVATAERWQKVLNVINSGEMPPRGEQPISDEQKSAFLKDLSEQMVVARGILSDSGGNIALRRLNRREYARTIKALLGVEPDTSNLPDDQATAGFDTQGASLFMSSDQIEQYLATAKRTLQLALPDVSASSVQTIRIEPEAEYRQRYSAAVDDLRDRQQRAAAYFAQADKPPSAFGFLDEYQVKKQRVQQWLPLLENYLERPETQSGITLIMTIKQGGYTRVKLPVLHEHQDGHYVVRVRAAAYTEANPRLHYLEFTSGFGNERTRLGWRHVAGSLESPSVVEFPFEHRRGHKTQLQITQRSHQDRADKNQATIDQRKNGIGTPPGLWIDWVELVGPVRDESVRNAVTKMMFEKPPGWDDAHYGREVLRRFAERAFRGSTPNDAYLDKLTQRYLANRGQGLAIRQAILDPLSIILASPTFLYMVESSGAEESDALTGQQLAVRLSYFLWSAPPDDELMTVARDGRLLTPAVLRQQTKRLLADDRADEFVRGFVHQWLHLDRLGMFQFDGVQFPTFDNAARECAREEVFQTFQHLLSEGLPLSTLLKADFVVINDVMADYYQIPNVTGHQYRPVNLPAESLRGGLLGTAAVLAMGSDGQRSSPVERGAWVLRKLLHDPPPPAPANVPQLSRLDGQILSARKLTKAHQEQPQCANCHQKIDPIGFGLENFDAVGLWRETEVIGGGRFRFGQWEETTEFDIDASGQLTDGQTFSGYFGLRDAVASHDEPFARGFTESLITYGLGRPYGFTDQDLADDIMQRAKSGGYGINDFIDALVQSATFRTN